MIKVLGVKFKDACKIYDFDPADINVRRGERVIVDTEKGVSLATVATEIRELAEEAVTKELKKIVRVATPEDIDQEKSNKEKEALAKAACLTKIRERGLPMKLVNVEYMFDGNKAVFYFTADGRIDFRELVRDLAHEFHIRIEMKQIGVRDAAKMLGGMGPCGKELCCSTFLTDFGPVSVKMAKEQGLPLNPAKISGVCGRLMCCLSYEYGQGKEGKSHKPHGGHHGHGGHGGGCGGGCHGGHGKNDGHAPTQVQS